MKTVEVMYDSKDTIEKVEHTCKICNEPISDEEFEKYDGWCEYCDRHERLSFECEKCGNLLTETEYCLQDFMCEDCYNKLNNQ